MKRPAGRLASFSVLRPQHAIVVQCALIIGSLGLTSCQTGAGGGEGVDSVQFQDVVVPDGFRLEDRGHQSYSREEAGWRHGHFVYRGANVVDAAAAYVLGRMPEHSWVVVNEEAVEDNGMRLRFERGIYSADYSFSRKDGSTQMVVDYATDYSRR